MSKKSRKRNKKILAMLALAGGAAMAGRRKRNAAIDTGIASAEADKGSAMLADSAPVVKTDTAPAVAADTGSSFQTPFKRKVDGKWMGPNELRLHRLKTAGNLVPPSMRSGAEHAEGYQKHGVIGTRTGTGRPQKVWGWSGTPSLRAKGGRIGAKKGGSVTGIAKRGFGRALMKGKK